ncbi:hypothetical protein CsatB_011835 [Cannabis sativa]|uniref:AT-hook motif nuclear-localized protein n=2 Tax=Cannabis sativa TaxID=3483 RepID=A0A7J6GUZ1_CANSA|nr:AT-hook motif nuclear-localized protein 11 [Cannabis sativa]XP_030490064.1 AT-hook motif nuclear-localized protein 11 [Cannabis sativa]KAF4386725.1 hypothetical protein F8388_006680 [Cannabis sativa]KAF4392864.1 hypothetical protein G4B88_011859 [Cannabis sativa]
MDRRDPMALSGSAAYYAQRGIGVPGSGAQPELHGSPGMHQLSNPNVSFQSNMGGSNMGSTLPAEPPSAMSSHGVNVGGGQGMMSSSEQIKRKRGRPRKYGPDGSVSLQLSPSPATNPGMASPTQKRSRGRPKGTGKKQQLASLGEWLSGSAGMGFTPHVITIAIGEDIATKIMSFSQQGPRALCILSASGAVSTVSLRQPSSSGGTVTYEGRFEIVCLTGSYLITDSSGSRNRSGGLSVTLANAEGRVIGGSIGGALIAASPVQVIVGSFIWGGSKIKNNKRQEAIEGPTDSVDNPLGMQNQNQSLTPTSSVGVWPASRSLDMRNAHMDIDLMRG